MRFPWNIQIDSFVQWQCDLALNIALCFDEPLFGADVTL